MSDQLTDSLSEKLIDKFIDSMTKSLRGEPNDGSSLHLRHLLINSLAEKLTDLQKALIIQATLLLHVLLVADAEE